MPEIEPSHCVWASAAIGVACHFGLSRAHLYEIECSRDAAKASCRLLVHWARILLFFAAVAALSYYASDFSHVWFLCIYLIGAALIGNERVVNACVYRASARRGFCHKKFAIIGSGHIADTLVSQLHEKTGTRIVSAWVAKTLESDPSADTACARDVPICDGVDALLELRRTESIDAVILRRRRTRHLADCRGSSTGSRSIPSTSRWRQRAAVLTVFARPDRRPKISAASSSCVS
jgi:FlaA1/EpsC-like NDP-sugar epimerase